MVDVKNLFVTEKLHLPTDLIYQIAGLSDKSTLAKLCQSSKGIAELAEKKLYSKFYSKDLKRLLGFLQGLLRKPQLIVYVQDLTISSEKNSPSHIILLSFEDYGEFLSLPRLYESKETFIQSIFTCEIHQSKSQAWKDTVLHFFEEFSHNESYEDLTCLLILICTNIRSLKIDSFIDQDISGFNVENMERVLRLAIHSHPNLEKVHFIGNGGLSANSERFFYAATLIPSVKELTVHGTLLQWGGGSHNHWSFPPTSIQKGDYPHCHTIELLAFTDTLISPSFMQTVFPRFHGLKTFKCEQVPSAHLHPETWCTTFLDPATCKELLVNSKSSLEEITLSDSMARKNEFHHVYYPSSSPYPSKSSRSLSDFQNLKHMSVHITMLAGRGTAEIRPRFTQAQSWDFAKNLPPTLGTLQITNDLEEMEACLTNLILNAPPSLQMVSISKLHTGSGGKAQFKEMQRLARDRGIILSAETECDGRDRCATPNTIT